MKKLVMSLVLAVACMGLGVSYAEMSKSPKDECLLISKGCKDATMSLQEKIDKLNVEINKGKRVYTADELKKLEDKLKDAEKTLDDLLKY